MLQRRARTKNVAVSTIAIFPSANEFSPPAARAQHPPSEHPLDRSGVDWHPAPSAPGTEYRVRRYAGARILLSNRAKEISASPARRSVA